MKDYIVVLTLLVSLFGSVVVCLLSTRAVFAASVTASNERCGYEAAMDELNRRDHRHKH